MPYRQGIDYGPRQGTLGLSFHMAEGGDGTLGFLSRHDGEDLHQWAERVRGVSCNALLLTDGTVWQMLDYGHASGNLNPDDRADEYGYYGGHYLREVLGDHWPDPNTWTVSMEICGFRAAGPNDAQVASAIKWGLAMRARFPSIRGATGHHDQSPKGCPGVTANMKAIFAGVGGHGIWEADMRFVKVIEGKLLPVADGDHWLYIDGSIGGTFNGPGHPEVIGTVDGRAGQYLVRIGTGKPYDDGKTRPTDVLVRSTRTLVDAPVPTPTGDPNDPTVKSLIEGAVNAALDHVSPKVVDVGRAIDEARLR